MVGVGIWG